jgi:acetyl esterase
MKHRVKKDCAGSRQPLLVTGKVVVLALLLGACGAFWPARDALDASLHTAPPGRQAAVRTEDIAAPGPAGQLPLRVYYPEGGNRLPVVLYYHGGGWVYGNLDTHEEICRFFAAAVPAAVIAVDYRRAPLHKFPAASEDAYAALVWAAQNAERVRGDRNRIAVCGDSAGGNLAAVVCLMARDRGGPKIALQVLAFPATNLFSFDTESYRSYGTGKSLTLKQMAWFRELYLKGTADRSSPYASPLLATSLSGLPVALVITGELDVLRDEGEAYAQRLQQQGVAARCLRLPGQAHAVVYWTATAAVARPALDAAVEALQSAFAGQ